MSIPYVFTLDSLAFGARAQFFKGPAIYHQPQRWSEMKAIGHTGVDATILTFIGLESQRWECTGVDGSGVMCSTAEKDKLVAVYNARTAVTFKTPQDSTGVSVIMTKLEIGYGEPGPNSMFLCKFTLVRRA